MEILDQPLEESFDYNDFNVQPSATDAFKYALDIFKEKFVDFLLLTLLVGAVSAVAAVIGAFAILITAPVSYGAAYIYLKAIRKEEFKVADVFDGFNQYKDVLIASVLVALLVVIGIILLIIPGIIVAIRLSFVPYLVMDKKMTGTDAIKESWEMTNGYGFEIFLFGILATLIIFAGLLLFFVGVFPAIMWVQASFATFYQSVESKRRKSNNAFDDDELV